jgi:AcrR family transcriptional regulator
VTDQRQPAKWGDKDARQLDIRDAARTILERDGLAGLSMRTLAKDAGVAPGTLYTYFPSKEALYADLYAERLEQMRDDIATRCASATSSVEILRAVADLYVEIYAVFGRELDAWSVLAGLDDSTDLNGPLDDSTVRLVHVAVEVFSDLLSQLQRVDPELADAVQQHDQIGLQLLWAAVSGLAEHFASARHLVHETNRERLTDLGSRVLIAGLRAELLP